MAFPDARIAAFVGGLHLMHSSNEEIRQVARIITDTNIGLLYTGHCTGSRAFELLSQKLPGRVIALYPGLRLSF